MPLIHFPLPLDSDSKGLHQNEGRDCATFSPMAPTALNYGAQPWRIPRLPAGGISYFAGLAQFGMSQWFSGLNSAFLPPPVIPTTRSQTGSIGRNVMGAGTQSAATRHIPAVRLPRVVT